VDILHLIPYIAMEGADLVHGTLSLLVTGAYVSLLLFGHSRQMMNHEHVGRVSDMHFTILHAMLMPPQ
jgi:hypothetical protein